MIRPTRPKSFLCGATDMHIRVLVLVSFALLDLLSSDAAAGPRHVVGKRFDFNSDGKINAMERAAGRMTMTQQREQRSMHRNDRFVR